MAKKIMHLLFTGKHGSPFDINMAADAGYDLAIPYTDVALDDVVDLVQDAIFSRPPGYISHSGVFVGGRDINLAADMLKAAQSAMFHPFELSVMADPNGAYTTSGALFALAEHHLQVAGKTLHDQRVVIFGGGPVGVCTAVLAYRAGAKPVLARLTPGTPAKLGAMKAFLARFDADAEFVSAESTADKTEALQSADLIVSTAKAGVEVLDAAMLGQHCRAVVALDVNAVPPAGIAGVDVNHNGIKIEHVDQCIGVGALAIGNIKYKTQQALLKKMLVAERVEILDFLDAYKAASSLVAA